MGEFKHGLNGYTNYGCRCDECSEANNAYMSTFRRSRRGTLAPDDPRHGTSNGYTNYGCRCQSCTEVHSAQRARWAAARAAASLPT